MAENPKTSTFEEEADNDDSSLSSSDDLKCVKLSLPKNIAAYVDKRELQRDVNPITCDNDLVEKVMNNYVIVKRILRVLSWQEKMICKHVCSLWHSAVLALLREQQGPADCVIALQHASSKSIMKFKQSGILYNEPLAVLTFANEMGFNMSHKCRSISPYPCSPPCSYEHTMVDVLQNNVSAPKNCMLAVRSNCISFMSLPSSPTYEFKITQKMFLRPNPFISCLYIPMMPDVEFKVISIRNVEEMQKKFYDVIDELEKKYIFKTVLAYVTEAFLFHSVEEVVFLNYLKKVQPDIPYALGGCIVEDVIYDTKSIADIVKSNNENVEFVSGSLVNVGLFLVPKDSNRSNFDSFSLILNSSEWAKARIQKSINEFANMVPQFEHSIALKLSCVGRDQKHEIELKYFRAAFPHTRIIGCYGNGELGLSHPERSNTDTGAKRYRYDPGEQFGIMYSYSTVFVYIGWGKLLSASDT